MHTLDCHVGLLNRDDLNGSKRHICGLVIVAVDSQDHRSRKITNQYWRCSRPRLSELRLKIQMFFMLMMAHGTVTLISPMW